MPDQNSNATAGDNAGNNNNADTSAANKQNEGQQQNSSNTSNDAKQNEGGQNQGAKTFTQDEVNSLLAKERKAAEKKAADAEAKSKMAEDERTKLELEEARAALRERDTRDSIIEAANAAGVKNPRLFYNAYKSEIETDEKGKIANLKEVLAAAKKEAPELFGAAPGGSADGGAKGEPTGKTMNDWMRGR